MTQVGHRKGWSCSWSSVGTAVKKLATNKLNQHTIITIQNTSTNLLNLAYERFTLAIILYVLLLQSGVSVFGCGGAPMAKMCQNGA